MSLRVRVEVIDQPAVLLDSEVLPLSDDEVWRLARYAIQSADSRHMNLRVVLWDRTAGGEWTLAGTCTQSTEAAKAREPR